METVDYKLFELVSGDRVLDLGCGEGRHVISAYLDKDIEAVGVDLSFDDLKKAKEKFADFEQPDASNKSMVLSVANALELPFADNSFDKVICSEVLEHIPNYLGALKEIQRVLKSGGVFCASVPSYWPEKVCWYFSDEYHSNVGGHPRIFKEQQLRDEIESSGFKCFNKHKAHALHSPFWWMKCMAWEKRDSSKLISAYHEMLVWDMMKRPWLTRTTEKLLNPVIGKSIVMYFRKGYPS